MKNNRVFGILILTACAALLIWGFRSIIILTIIKYTGQKVAATVVEVPSICVKTSSIKVAFNGSTGKVNISKEDCSNGLYKPGQQVTLLKHERYDDFVWPGSRPELVLVLIIAILLFVYFNAKKGFEKVQNKILRTIKKRGHTKSL
jgi:hypothetical protein